MDNLLNLRKQRRRAVVNCRQSIRDNATRSVGLLIDYDEAARRIFAKCLALAEHPERMDGHAKGVAPHAA
jgi:hypothetical protein